MLPLARPARAGAATLSASSSSLLAFASAVSETESFPNANSDAAPDSAESVAHARPHSDRLAVAHPHGNASFSHDSSESNTIPAYAHGNLAATVNPCPSAANASAKSNAEHSRSGSADRDAQTWWWNAGNQRPFHSHSASHSGAEKANAYAHSRSDSIAIRANAGDRGARTRIAAMNRQNARLLVATARSYRASCARLR